MEPLRWDARVPETLNLHMKQSDNSDELKLDPTLQQDTEEGEGESQNDKTPGTTEVLQDNWEPEPSQYYR